MLSNFYACTCKLAGYTFPSVGHAYQALQKVDGNIDDWTTEGIYSKWGKVYNIVNKYRKKRGKNPLKPGRWKRRNQIGILAKLVISHSQAFGLDLKARDDALAISYEKRWRPIFEAKYSDPILQRTLLGTTGRLIEFKRGGHRAILNAFNRNLAAGANAAKANQVAQKMEIWGAFNYEKYRIVGNCWQLSDTVWGQNVTGKNLTRYRDEKIFGEEWVLEEYGDELIVGEEWVLPERKRCADTKPASAAPASKRGKLSVSTEYFVEYPRGM